MGIAHNPVCSDQLRRSLIIGRTDLNGIDYVDINPSDHSQLTVFFLNPVPPLNPANPADTNDAYGLSTNLSKITISGGTRIVGIQAKKASRNPDGSILLQVNEAGDYSVYTLALDATALDPMFAQIDFSFMATCPVDFDCRTLAVCPPPQLTEPLFDYEAKDYSSFRKFLLDLLPRFNPSFIETNPSDLGIALIELLAYYGDHLSYFQDAVVNEAYLGTVRQRISARRLSKLIDYRMHDGRNAWAFVHLAVNQATSLPMGTKILSRIGAPLAGTTSPPGVIVDASRITADSMQSDPALSSVAAFETAFPIQLDPLNNVIFIYEWGNEECCLSTGATDAFLYSVQADGVTVVRPTLKKGDYLLFEEVLGRVTGVAADADPSRRQVVLIDEDPEQTSDSLYSNQLLNGVPQAIQGGQQPLPLLHVHWRSADALQFSVCISARRADGNLIREISAARGNIVLADHGLSTSETIPLNGPVPEIPPFRPRLSFGPLTMQIQPTEVQYDSHTGRLATPRTDLTGDVRTAQPAISLFATSPTGEDLWTPAPDLLESSPFDTSFVPEVDNSDRAVLRFGDDEYGRSIAGTTALVATYRIGNGIAGNVGADALAHVAPDPPLVGITRVRNPLPAEGGVDPETIPDVQQWAPEAFRAVQFRAVTEADYQKAAELLPQVQSAVASFRWTGSWYTVFIGILPSNPSDLINEAKGIMELAPSLDETVRAFLDGYRLAGYDLEIRPPQFLPLEIDLLVCAADDYFRSDVQQAVESALSNQLLPDGSKGFFYPGNFVFGQPVYLSQIYKVVQSVEGVDSVVVTTFRPFGQPDNGELANGVIPVGPWQIARLDNDPNFMERGVLKITMRGGKL